jgi:hypothetical protein
VLEPSDTNGSRLRAVPLSPTRRSRSESPAAGRLCHLFAPRLDCDRPRVDGDNGSPRRRGSRSNSEARPSGAPLLREPSLAPFRPPFRGRSQATDHSASQKPYGRGALPRPPQTAAADEATHPPTRGLPRRDAGGDDLPRVRAVLHRGSAGCALRVRSPDRRPERPVPRALPDGGTAPPPVRPRRLRGAAGTRCASLFRLLGS